MARKGIENNVADDERFLKAIAVRIKSLRLEMKTSAEDLADSASVGRSQFSRYENGTSDLRLTSLRRIIKALGKTPSEFFAGID